MTATSTLRRSGRPERLLRTTPQSSREQPHEIGAHNRRLWRPEDLAGCQIHIILHHLRDVPEQPLLGHSVSSTSPRSRASVRRARPGERRGCAVGFATGQATFWNFMERVFYLEEIPGRRVDPVCEEGHNGLYLREIPDGIVSLHGADRGLKYGGQRHKIRWPGSSPVSLHHTPPFFLPSPPRCPP